MPYDPLEPTERERSNVYFLNWVGLAATLGLVTTYFTPLFPSLAKILLAITSAILLVSIFSSRFDDYYNSLRNAGCRWAVGIIALGLVAATIMTIGNISNQLGFLAASGELEGSIANDDNPLAALPSDLVLRLACAAFFLGIEYKKLRS